MKGERIATVVMASMIAFLLACTSLQSRRPLVEHVSGKVTYLERMALPPDAVVTVTLADVSRMDAPAQVVAQTTIRAEGIQVPIPFEIAYDPAAIDEASTYAVRAQIHLEDRLLFTSDTAHHVITRGHPDEVDLILVRASSE